MKLLAPRNDWNMTSPRESNWWGMAGGVATPAGIQVSESAVMKLSAVSCGVRVISETLASLPCALLEQTDYRTTAKATSHPLWPIVHDVPNPEQDVMTFLDSQVGLQVLWGNAYAEIQRNSLGEIVALWPIHPSRIPLCNIMRNATDPSHFGQIVTGEPGEIVYYVKNNDGTTPPIAASDMFHVPGVPSGNGITGDGLVRRGANAIGIALATEEHAGAYFRNGAVSNMAIRSPKIVGKETADRLRQQWQQVFAGSQNHYKTLLLEDGMEAVPFSIDPEKSQLLLARMFGVTETSRLLRLPPHFLGDLTRATFSNIEQQSLDFVIYSMIPWITRWEKAMFRQLLTPEEQKKYRFKFNVMGLLRGDSAARSAFYRSMFDMGAYSPNDILELEDRNPVKGGDQRFVPGNNLVPLDKIGELAQANIDKAKAPPAPKFNQQPQPPAQPDQVPPDQVTDLRTDLIELRRLQEQLIEGVEERDAAVLKAVAKTPTSEEMRQELTRVLTARETTESDQLAVREHNARQSLQSVCDAIQLAIEGETRQLMQYEVRAAKDAANKNFLAWRDKFYPEFTAKLTTAISVFVPAARAVGIEINGEVAAAEYVSESISIFDPLLDLKDAEFVSRLQSISDTWADRPTRLAAEIMKGVAC